MKLEIDPGDIADLIQALEFASNRFTMGRTQAEMKHASTVREKAHRYVKAAEVSRSGEGRSTS
jgi:hypothetical protein